MSGTGNPPYRNRIKTPAKVTGRIVIDLLRQQDRRPLDTPSVSKVPTPPVPPVEEEVPGVLFLLSDLTVVSVSDRRVEIDLGIIEGEASEFIVSAYNVDIRGLVRHLASSVPGEPPTPRTCFLDHWFKSETDRLTAVIINESATDARVRVCAIGQL